MVNKLGLYNKFFVQKVEDPDGKHANCRYFVLDLTHDPHARSAAEEYVNSCFPDYPTLAADLLAVLDSLDANE